MMTAEQQKRRHAGYVMIANQLAQFINNTKALKTSDIELNVVYSAHAILLDLIIKHDRLERAALSLATGVEELQAEYPHLDLPSEGRHNDLIGFLFATLPLTQEALK